MSVHDPLRGTTEFFRNLLGQPTATPATTSYEALVEKVKAGNNNIDFRELRLAYVDSATRKKAKDTDAQKKAMSQALRDQDYKSVLENAQAVLQQDFVDIDAHFAEYTAYRELKQSEQTEREKYIVAGLLDSITSSGDGKTLDTAYQVINVHEEYVVLRFDGLMPSKQSLQHKDGHSFDVMETVDPKTNKKVTYYFNVDIPFAHYLK